MGQKYEYLSAVKKIINALTWYFDKKLQKHFGFCSKKNFLQYFQNVIIDSLFSPLGALADTL